MVIKKVSNSKLINLIEEIILEQQDEAILEGLLAAEIRLALFQKYEIEVHSNRIARLMKYNITGVKKIKMPTYIASNGVPINIYRIEK